MLGTAEVMQARTAFRHLAEAPVLRAAHHHARAEVRDKCRGDSELRDDLEDAVSFKGLRWR